MRAQIQPRGDYRPLDEQTEKEISGFYRALDSYVRQAAIQPGLTFKRHLTNVLSSDHARTANSRVQ